MTTSRIRSGIIALTTDFGILDPYVGMMKAVILSRAPAVCIVDVTHGVPPQDVRVGAFWLARSAAYFPAGTVHVAVVDPGVGSARRLLVAEARGQCFLAPDNGLLSGVLDDAASVFELDGERFALPRASHTFHGRDVLAPAAAAIANGLAAEEAGRRAVRDWVRLPPAVIERSADGRRIEAEVLFVDRFGNAVLNLAASDLEPDPASWRAKLAGAEVPFARTYAQVPAGGAVLLVDSFDALEIAVNGGDAAARFGLARGARVTLENRGEKRT
jgi:S-adenosylmethionine hydrolase